MLVGLHHHLDGQPSPVHTCWCGVQAISRLRHRDNMGDACSCGTRDGECDCVTAVWAGGTAGACERPSTSPCGLPVAPALVSAFSPAPSKTSGCRLLTCWVPSPSPHPRTAWQEACGQVPTALHQTPAVPTRLAVVTVLWFVSGFPPWAGAPVLGLRFPFPHCIPRNWTPSPSPQPRVSSPTHPDGPLRT